MTTEVQIHELTKLVNQLAAVCDFLLAQQGLAWSNDLSMPVNRKALDSLKDGAYANKTEPTPGA